MSHTHTQKLEVSVEVPEGWLATKLDFLRKGDRYLDQDGYVRTWSYPYQSSYRQIHIVRHPLGDLL